MKKIEEIIKKHISTDYLKESSGEYYDEVYDSDIKDLVKDLESLLEESKSVKAVKYMIGIWDEVTDKTWRERPDHVQQKFLEAEKDYLKPKDDEND